MSDVENYGKKVSEGISGADIKDQLFDNRESERGFGDVSQKEKYKHVVSSGKNRKTGNSTSSDRGTVSGGILKQFIRETDNQLKLSISRTNELRERKNQLIQLFQQLCEKTGEEWSELETLSND